MKGAVIKTESVSSLLSRFGDVFERRDKHLPGVLPTGIAEIDEFFNGFPRGAITEIHGAPSSGRTSLLLSSLALATRHEEICALIDCYESFDLSSATKAGISFDRLLWVRCNHNLERAFKAVDLLLHSGGFGLIALNLGDVPAKTARRIISSWWFRFRRAVENTPTVLMVITPIASVRSCASLVLELATEKVVWPSSLSLVSENSNGSLTDAGKEKRRHLSLVGARMPQLPDTLPLTHAHFIQGAFVRVNRERPVEWSEAVVRFNPQLH